MKAMVCCYYHNISYIWLRCDEGHGLLLLPQHFVYLIKVWWRPWFGLIKVWWRPWFVVITTHFVYLIKVWWRPWFVFYYHNISYIWLRCDEGHGLFYYHNISYIWLRCDEGHGLCLLPQHFVYLIKVWWRPWFVFITTTFRIFD